MRAAPAHLPQMLAAARAAAPQLRVLEDCRSADPRLLVRFPVAGQRFRVHPGSLLNPVLILLGGPAGCQGPRRVGRNFGC